MSQGSLQDMVQVANNCSAYDSVQSGAMQSSTGAQGKTCKNCKHLKVGKCELDLYDKNLASLDQS